MNLDDLVAKLAKAPLGQRLALLGVLAVALVAGNYFLFYSDIANAKTVATQKQRTDQAEYDKEMQAKTHVLEYRNQIAQLEERAKRQENVLPSKSEIPALIEQVSGQAQVAGLQITVFKPGEEVPQGNWIKIPVAMEVLGTFQQIGKFFNDLGQLPRIVNVEDLTLDQPQEKEGRTVLRAAFTVVTYRLPDHKPATAAPTPGAPAPLAGGAPR